MFLKSEGRWWHLWSMIMFATLCGKTGSHALDCRCSVAWWPPITGCPPINTPSWNDLFLFLIQVGTHVCLYVAEWCWVSPQGMCALFIFIPSGTGPFVFSCFCPVTSARCDRERDYLRCSAWAWCSSCAKKSSAPFTLCRWWSVEKIYTNSLPVKFGLSFPPAVAGHAHLFSGRKCYSFS